MKAILRTIQQHFVKQQICSIAEKVALNQRSLIQAL